MSNGDREGRLVRAFVQLADSLVGDFDVTDLLQGLVEHCVDLLGVDAAGLLLSDNRGALAVVASSAEHVRLVELFQLQANEGPCLDCFRSGAQVAVADLAAAAGSWPRFVPAALGEGYAAVHAFPLRLREEVIGAMNLFSHDTATLSDDDQLVAQALADVATIGILSERVIGHHEMVVEQLEGALHSRVVIEQAKGVLAEATGCDVGEAYVLLRAAARNTHARLAQVAGDLVEGRLAADAIVAAANPDRAGAPGG